MMDVVTFAGGKTSRIAFGCGRLVGGAGLRASARLVEAARDLGITHFDVAPSYGLGLAEDVLGEVLAGDVAATVATKVGIGRPKNPGFLSVVRQIARPLLASTPAIKAWLAKGASAGAERKAFNVAQMEASIAESLRRLRRGSVDALLLHEPDPEGVGPEAQAFLEGLLARGTAKTIGSGTGGRLHGLPDFGTVRQYRWDLAGTPVDEKGTHILHGVMRSLAAPSDAERAALANAMRKMGCVSSNSEAAPAALLSLALGSAPGAIILISTNDPVRLRSTIARIDWEVASGGRREILSAFRDASGHNARGSK
ncbi:aldo/keto reductase [Sphingomonas sp. NFR15]|uniref:aldo/keto reductase n=1 Tax=Sphingomonas sp. NFR15 TaxID=1566282 RepID=UPI0008870056|nr:aldo/keto reductase [Sphingomonas sp. NFR15]SDA36958.1 Aldo/keto reductase family protein [Sphingomonas sp. NFR15]